MGIKYNETTGLPSNENVDYNKLLEMWRDEKKKRQEAEDRIKELENSLSITLDLNDTLQRHNAKIIIQIEELKAELARAEEDRQYDNLVHKRELADLFKGRYGDGLISKGKKEK